MEEIAQLMKRYLNDKTVCSKSFIHEVVRIYIKSNNLNDFFNKVVFKTIPYQGTYLSVARYDDGDIIVDTRKLSYAITKECQVSNVQFFSKAERIMFINCFVLQILFHELQHVSQQTVINKSVPDSFEEELIMWSSASINLWSCMSEGQMMYDKLYGVLPIERMAQIKSRRNLIAVLEKTKDLIPSIYSYEQRLLFDESFRDYSISCPTEIFFRSIDLDSVWKNEKFYDNDRDKMLHNVQGFFSLDDRLLLGLPVSENETDEKRRLLKK